MPLEQVIQLGRTTLEYAILAALPLLAIATVVSIVINILQVLTSIQDQTVSTVPRLLATALSAMFLLPWMLRHLAAFTIHLFSDFRPSAAMNVRPASHSNPFWPPPSSSDCGSPDCCCLLPASATTPCPARTKAAFVVFSSCFSGRLCRFRRCTSHPSAWTGIALNELLIGIIVGLLLSFIFDAAQFAGQILGMQMGFSLATMIDPQSQADSAVLSVFYQTIVLLIFFALDVHHWVCAPWSPASTTFPPDTPCSPPDASRPYCIPPPPSGFSDCRSPRPHSSPR